MNKEVEVFSTRFPHSGLHIEFFLRVLEGLEVAQY